MLPIRVVIADDSENYRSALRKLLTKIPGTTVVAEAATGAETLHAVRETKPDLLILDVHMPQKSGWNVLRELRESGSSVRVLVHSGYGGDEYERLAIQNGAAAFVAKGNAQLLIDTLTQLKQEA